MRTWGHAPKLCDADDPVLWTQSLGDTHKGDYRSVLMHDAIELFGVLDRRHRDTEAGSSTPPSTWTEVIEAAKIGEEARDALGKVVAALETDAEVDRAAGWVAQVRRFSFDTGKSLR